jgi:hypothetical protein
MSKCKRCGKDFEPTLLKALNKLSTHCITCMCRNLHDGLGLPTPPELLDKHTLKPTLSEEEFMRKLQEETYED